MNEILEAVKLYRQTCNLPVSIEEQLDAFEAIVSIMDTDWVPKVGEVVIVDDDHPIIWKGDKFLLAKVRPLTASERGE